MPRKQLHYEGEMCDECGINPKAFSGYNLNGNRKYRAVCTACHKGRYGKPWLKFRGTECEMCGYTPMFQGSLDVHHRDGDKSNNDTTNLMTVCATCHRELEAIIHQCDGDHEKAESLFTRFMKALVK